MATTKVLLDKRRARKNGTYPLVVRVFTGKKFKDINLKTPLLESYFDSKAQKVTNKHPNQKVINQKIRKTVLQVEETTLNLEMKDEVISASKIRSTIVKPASKFNFMQYGEKMIADMRNVNRNGNANAYRDAISALKTYSGKANLEFTELTYELLCSVENKMLAKGLKKNSIACYNRSLRAIFNNAINNDLVEIKHYPYRKYKIKGEATAKRNISKEDIAAMVNMQLEPDSPLWHSRNYFMLSFNLRGISFTDMASIRPCDITNGRLTYLRKKTHKMYNIKLTDRAKEIISLYQKTDEKYILPVLTALITPNSKLERATIQQANKTCNKYLERIGNELKLPQKLTSYFSRHSWATIAKRMGYSKDLISEALGHSQGNRITEVYLDTYDQQVIDDMNEAVCKF